MISALTTLLSQNKYLWSTLFRDGQSIANSNILEV